MMTRLVVTPVTVVGVLAYGLGLPPTAGAQQSPLTSAAPAFRVDLHAPAPSPLPKAWTGEAIYPGTTVAILTGTINARNQRTRFKFQYGRTRPYAHTQFGERELLGHRTSEVSEAVGDLKPGTTYHYRIIAFNKYGFVTGKDRTFRTLKKTDTP